MYALISVFDKSNVSWFAKELSRMGFRIISSGGTHKKLCQDLPDTKIFQVSDLTQFPEAFGGRVKTLHPIIHGGILHRRNHEDDLAEKEKLGVVDLRIVVCNLYPFKKTVSGEHTLEDAIENIDIGGHTLIRAAAKNYHDVYSVIDPKDYNLVLDSLKEIDSWQSRSVRKQLATKAFQHAMEYDVHISNYLSEDVVGRVYHQKFPLKYGCNPHQHPSGAFSINDEDFPFAVKNGNPGYINILDAMGAWNLVKEIKHSLNLPAAASFKHTSPAGVGTSVPLSEDLRRAYMVDDLQLSDVATAYVRARNADPLSSFGDFIAISDVVDLETAKMIKREVSDGIIAPGYEKEAFEILRNKKNGNYLVLEAKNSTVEDASEKYGNEYREIGNMCLSQKIDWKVTTRESASSEVSGEGDLPETAIRDMVIANITLKYTQSNSVAYACDGQVIGVGAGQQNRVDCVKLAGNKARVWMLRQHPDILNLMKCFRKTGENPPKRQDKVNALMELIEDDFTHEEYDRWLGAFDKDLLLENFAGNFLEWKSSNLKNKKEYLDEFGGKGICMASDGFFPFRDSIDQAAKRKVKYVLQPGGSLADKGVSDACDQHGMVMSLSGTRVFTH